DFERTRCSCLLCSSQGATSTHAEPRQGLDAAASVRACFHSLKTEEKTVTAGDRCSREGPNPWRPRGRMADSPPVHQQVCLNWTVRMTIFSREALLRKE